MEYAADEKGNEIDGGRFFNTDFVVEELHSMYLFYTDIRLKYPITDLIY